MLYLGNTIILPVVLYGCEISSSTLKEGQCAEENSKKESKKVKLSP
jgi:hypothetical protein